jgi:hypothetical protein
VARRFKTQSGTSAPSIAALRKVYSTTSSARPPSHAVTTSNAWIAVAVIIMPMPVIRPISNTDDNNADGSNVDGSNVDGSDNTLE